MFAALSFYFASALASSNKPGSSGFLFAATSSSGVAAISPLIKPTNKIRSTLLEPGSALVLQDAGRYQWMHRIMARTSDHNIPRGRRVSLTYRNVILGT
jgi:hypothetical protein